MNFFWDRLELYMYRCAGGEKHAEKRYQTADNSIRKTMTMLGGEKTYCRRDKE